jgi:hypothetical protein
VRLRGVAEVVIPHDPYEFANEADFAAEVAEKATPTGPCPGVLPRL